MKVPKNSKQNNSETVTNEYDKEIPKERYISSEERQEIIDKLRLKQYNNKISENYEGFSHNNIIQRQLQMIMVKKCLKK